MKLPRNIDGDELANRLCRYGYHIIHQTGSHQRLIAVIDGKKHTITIPCHKPLRVGTLSGILKDIAAHHRIHQEDLIEDLFG